MSQRSAEPVSAGAAGSGRIGRPFDRSKDAQILTAVLDAVADEGYAHLTVDAIAAATGRAKSTIYRRWPTKADLALAAVRAAGRPPEADALPDTGSLRDDLVAFVDSPWLGGPERRLAVFAGLLVAARTSDDLAEAVRTQVTEPYVRAYRAMLDRAADRGLIPPEARRRIPLVARIIPAMSTEAIGSSTPPGRSHYVALVDDVVLPALGIG